MTLTSNFVLRVGEIAHIKRSFFGTSYSVIYAGILNEKVYSVVVTSASGHHAIAYNLFLPTQKTRINLPKGHLIVRKVTSDEIQFKFES